ncbi:MAG: hypothetical protein WCT18_00970 [Patescibacteria group bacterium]
MEQPVTREIFFQFVESFFQPNKLSAHFLKEHLLVGSSFVDGKKGIFINNRILRGELLKVFLTKWRDFLYQHYRICLNNKDLTAQAKRFCDGKKYYCRGREHDEIVKFFPDERLYLKFLTTGWPAKDLRDASCELSEIDVLFAQNEFKYLLIQGRERQVMIKLAREKKVFISLFALQVFHDKIRKHELSQKSAKRQHWDFVYWRELLFFLRLIFRAHMDKIKDLPMDYHINTNGWQFIFHGQMLVNCVCSENQEMARPARLLAA